MMKKLSFNARGFGLIEIMVAIGLLAVVAAAISGLGNVQLKQQVQSNITFQADSFRRTLMGNINNSKAWNYTVADGANASLACLNGGTCTQGVGGPVYHVRDPGNNVIYDWSGSNGLTAAGASCSGFNATAGSGNDLCPFQFQVNWTANCTVSGSPTCAAVNSQPQIAITVLYNPKSQAKTVSFNASQYGAIFFQGASNLACQWTNNAGALVETCASGVGVGLLTPMHTLDVLGDGNFSVGISTPYVTYTSDARLKTDLQMLASGGNELDSLHPLRFRWNDKAASYGLNDSQEHLGLLAQDVEKNFPEAVKTDRNGVKSVDYALLVVPVIQAVKDLQVENKALKKRLELLEQNQ
jgi:prepilin-type N-terminal cleavage/methylation domain-containing protein